MVLELNEQQKSLLGEWKLDSSENFDQYMKEIGIGYILRKVGAATKPNLKIACEGETFTVTVQSTFKNAEWRFKPNEKVRFTTIDDRDFWCVLELTEDGHLIEHQSQMEGSADVPSTIDRHVDDQGRLVAVVQANNVIGKRIYVRA